MTESTTAGVIREALDALYPAEDVKEVTLLDGPSVGYFDDRDALVRAILPHDGRRSIYTLLNPVDPACRGRGHNKLVSRAKHRATDTDILLYRYVLLDFDPGRPKGVASTDAELEAAVVRRSECLEYLHKEQGWPPMALAISGNGAHALPRLDLPRTTETEAACRDSLKALSARFSDSAVQVDAAVYNPARLTRLYGTVNVTGEPLTDRPHRRSRLESVPAPWLAVSLAQLTALAALAPGPTGPMSGTAPPGDLPPWDAVGTFQRAGLYRSALPPGRHAVRCPWAAEHSGGSGVTETVLFEPRGPGHPWGFKCHHHHCAGRAIRDVYRHLAGRVETLMPTPARRVGRIVTASTIAPASVQWQWPGRLARGVLTVGVGLPDQGKTLSALDVAARMSTGAPMPPAPRVPDTVARQSVLILTQEDTLDAVMVPRLEAAGADLTRVGFLTQVVDEATGRPSPFTLAQDCDVLGTALAEAPVGLVILDGLMGYLGRGADSHVDADMRRVLMPFVEILRTANAAGLGLMHPPKNVTSLSYYAGGSVAFSAIPRVVLGVAPHPDDPARRILHKLKGNLYGVVPTLVFRILAASPTAAPRLEWEPDPIDIDAAAVFTPAVETPQDRRDQAGCRAWLVSYLAAGRKPARQGELDAMTLGYAPRTVDRARQGLVKAVAVGRPGAQVWFWELIR